MNALLLALLITSNAPAPAEPKAEPPKAEEAVPDEHKIEVLGCSSVQGACLVSIEALAAYVEKRVEMGRQLEAKGCVAPPPKPKPKLKREINS